MRLIDALRYKSWADTRTLDAAARIDAPRSPQQEAFIRQQLNHMVRVEEVFRARLLAQPEPHTSTNSSEVPPLHALRQRLEASNCGFVRDVVESWGVERRNGQVGLVAGARPKRTLFFRPELGRNVLITCRSAALTEQHRQR